MKSDQSSFDQGILSIYIYIWITVFELPVDNKSQKYELYQNTEKIQNTGYFPGQNVFQKHLQKTVKY